MDNEAKYFRTGQLTATNVIFYANRFVGVVGVIAYVVYDGFQIRFAALCYVSFWMIVISNWLIIVLLDYILIIRITALYDRSKVLDVFLKVLLFAVSATALGILVYYTNMEDVHAAKVSEDITICALGVYPPRQLTIAWALPTANGFLLLCLTLYKAAEFPRRSEGFKGFELVRIIAQDQMIYFCWFMLLAVLRIVSLTIKNRTAAVFLLSTSNPASLCILGDLLLINLKEAGSRLLCDRTNYGTSYLIEEIEISRLS